MEYLKYLLILLFTIANAFEYLLVKAADVDIYLAGIALFGIAGIFSFIVAVAKRIKSKTLPKISFKLALTVGLISMLINILWLKGLQLTTATNASLLGKTDVAFSLLIAVAILREEITFRKLLYILLMAIGIFFVIEVNFNSLYKVNVGDLLVVLSAFLLAFNAFLVKRLMKDSADPFEVATINCLTNVIFFTIGWCFSSSHTITYESSQLTYIILAGFACFLFFCGYYPSLKIFPLWLVRALSLLTPILTVIGDLIVFKQTFTALQIVGSLLVFIGIVALILAERKKTTSL